MQENRMSSPDSHRVLSKSSLLLKSPNRSLNDTYKDTTSSNLVSDRMVYRFKIILLGDVAVGKTAIMTRFCSNKIDSNHICSVGVEYKIKSILLDDKTAADLQIWDTCGQEKYKTITRNYYRDSNGKTNYLFFRVFTYIRYN